MPKVLDNVIVAAAPDPATRTITLTWANGEKTVNSFDQLVGRGVFGALSDPAFFAQVRVGEGGRSLEWPGELDFCADALWFETHPEDAPEQPRQRPVDPSASTLSGNAQAGFRSEMPRVYELRSLIDDPAKPFAYFQDFESSLQIEPSKKRTWLAREREFQRLNADAWKQLRDEARPYLTARNTKGRGWEQLISILNQARAYNYLVDQGYVRVRFIPKAKGQKRKTPDVEGIINGRKVLCEVKTFNISRDEAERRQTGRPGATTNLLVGEFFEKLDASLRQAKNQMDSYDSNANVKRIVFVVINFDDLLGEYKADYFAQIDGHLAANVASGVEIVFYNQRTAFHPHVSMRHAHVVNERC